MWLAPMSDKGTMTSIDDIRQPGGMAVTVAMTIIPA
jgi:hypothetical protein